MDIRSDLISNPERLTHREYEVMCGLIMGKSYRAISEALGVSMNTVKFHSKNVYSKWNVTRRRDAIVFWAFHALAGTTGQLVSSEKGGEILVDNIHPHEKLKESFISSSFFQLMSCGASIHIATNQQLSGYEKGSQIGAPPKRSESNLQ